MGFRGHQPVNTAWWGPPGHPSQDGFPGGSPTSLLLSVIVWPVHSRTPVEIFPSWHFLFSLSGSFPLLAWKSFTSFSQGGQMWLFFLAKCSVPNEALLPAACCRHWMRTLRWVVYKLSSYFTLFGWKYFIISVSRSLYRLLFIGTFPLYWLRSFTCYMINGWFLKFTLVLKVQIQDET